MELNTYCRLISSEESVRKYLSKNAGKMDIDFAPNVGSESSTSWPIIDIGVPAISIRFTISRDAGSIRAD